MTPMPQRRRSRGRLLTAVVLVLPGFVEPDAGLLGARASLIDATADQDPAAAQDGPGKPSGNPDVQAPRGRRARPGAGTTAKSRQAAEKPATSKKSAGADAVEGAGDPSPSSAPRVSFKQEIAPILVANCVGCHSQGRPGLTRGKLDMTSFARLMAGTPKEKVITPGKPDESHLVLRIRGEEEPRMPQGGNNVLSEEAINRIGRWIEAGAVLDAGVDPKAPMESYALSPEQVRRNMLAKLGAKERDQLVEKAGRDRWKKANPSLSPEIISSEHFMLFSNLPRERATNASKFLEAQHALLRRLLGPSATDRGEKVSVYVFNNRKDLVELARTIEKRELDAEVSSIGNLKVAQPYLAVVDPLGGKKEEPIAARRRPRGKRAEDKEADASPSQSLGGLLARSLGEAAVLAEGKSPRWLAYGLGGYLGMYAEPRSPHTRRLKQHAHQRYDQGWITRATEVLGDGDQATAEDMRGIGLAIVDWLLSPELRVAFPAFAKGMSQGVEKLDDVLKDVYGLSREDFLISTGEWVAQQYGQGG